MSALTLESLLLAKSELELAQPRNMPDEIWVGNMVLAEAHVFRFIPEITDLPDAKSYFAHHWGWKVIEKESVPEMELWLIQKGVVIGIHNFGIKNVGIDFEKVKDTEFKRAHNFSTFYKGSNT